MEIFFNIFPAGSGYDKRVRSFAFQYMQYRQFKSCRKQILTIPSARMTIRSLENLRRFKEFQKPFFPKLDHIPDVALLLLLGQITKYGYLLPIALQTIRIN